ncbi:MAG TPA: group II intron reverse transcriptase/maturase, partial [Puia sp.]|nr:group II intron reverse transcriptase/maturase [Puia sp.]
MSQTKQKPFEIRFDRIVLAYKTVKANRGSHGVDNVSLEAYEESLQDNLYKLWNRMSSGSYFPQAVRQVEIDKKGGGKRPLGIPSVSDRIAQAVVKRELEIMLEPVFHEDSFGYRPHRSAADALGKARERCWKYKWVLDMDIKSFFEDISHELLMKAVRKHTNCKWHLLYIERWLKAPVQQSDGSQKEKVKGTPQGAVISPILANLFLHYCFDEWMRRNVSHIPFERYADDCVVHCQTENQARWVRNQLEARFQQCGLTLHPVKTKIVDCRQGKESRNSEHQEFDFLGHTFRKRRAKSKSGDFFTSYLPAVSKKSIKAIQEKIKECEPLVKTSGNLRDIAKELNPKIRGWFNSYGQFYSSELKIQLQYINRRLVLWARRK